MNAAFRAAGKLDPEAQTLVARINTEMAWFPEQSRNQLIDAVETAAGMPAMPSMGGLPGMGALAAARGGLGIPGMGAMPGMDPSANMGASLSALAKNSAGDLPAAMPPEMIAQMQKMSPEIRQQLQAAGLPGADPGAAPGDAAGVAGANSLGAMLSAGGPKAMMINTITLVLDRIKQASASAQTIAPADYDEVVGLFREQKSKVPPETRVEYAAMLENGFMGFAPPLRSRLVDVLKEK